MTLNSPIVTLVAPEVVAGQPVRGVAFYDSCWVDPVVPGVRLVASGPLGYLLCTVGWSYSCRDNRYDDNHCPDRNHRSMLKHVVTIGIELAVQRVRERER
mgnify:CR=1 FL=1